MPSTKKAPAPVRILLKKNDQVRVIAGRDEGKTGRVLDVNPRNGKILVEHVSMIKRHTRPNPAKQIKGGIAERESPIAVSNVKIVCPQCGPVRIAHHVETLPGGTVRRTRVCRKCGQTLDRK
ncbi:MAG TPA: 50S ribosomal protein L24 [Bryobacteraceae bacterium]|nr:50S ribosomal protein L24 [Bryobacteraceae bacterium]